MGLFILKATESNRMCVFVCFFVVFSCKDGIFRKYQGARTKEDFLSFVDEQKWSAVEPVSSWLGPSSFLWVYSVLISGGWFSTGLRNTPETKLSQMWLREVTGHLILFKLMSNTISKSSNVNLCCSRKLRIWASASSFPLHQDLLLMAAWHQFN